MLEEQRAERAQNSRGAVDAGKAAHLDVDSGDKAMIILQTMICYMREKNVFSRADIEVLRERVETRIDEAHCANERADAAGASLPCDATIAKAAASEMRELDEYCGKLYGGKHRRRVN